MKPSRLSRGNEEFWSRLRESAKVSRERLQPFREQKLKHASEFAGARYGDANRERETPVPFLEQHVSTLLARLVPLSPRCSVRAANPALRPSAAEQEDEINRIGARCMRDALYDAVESALFCGLGTLKIGIDDELAPVVASIDIDDLVFDTDARGWAEVTFFGHRYRAFREDVEAKSRREIPDLPGQDFNKEGDARANALTVSPGGRRQRLYDTLELWEFYLPRHPDTGQPCLVTFLDDEMDEPLDVKEWHGPACGPYEFLWFARVPGQLMPLSPLLPVLPLHELCNSIACKLNNQARRQKTMLAFRGRSDEDARRITNTADGESVRCDDPDSIREVSTGGPNANLLASLMQFGGMYDRHAGNLTALGGLAAQSPTAKQDQLLGASASVRVDAMGHRVLTLAERSYYQLAFWVRARAEARPRNARKKLPYAQFVDLPYTFDASRIEGEIDDFEYAPWSMDARTPASRAQARMQMLHEVLLPLAPAMAQQGLSIDVATTVRGLADDLSMPELAEMLRADAPQQMDAGAPQQAGGAPGGSPPRQAPPRAPSRSIATPDGQGQVLMRALMGQASQPAEAARLG